MKPGKSDSQDPAERVSDPDMAGADAAIHRAAMVARRRAAERGGAIAVFEDGKVVWMAVDKDSLSLRPRGDA